MRDLERGTTLDVLKQIVKALEAGGSSATQFADASSLLGRGFKDLAPDIKLVLDRMDEFVAKGRGLSSGTITATNENQKWWGEMWSAGKEKVNTATGAVGSAMSEAVNRVMLGVFGGFMGDDRRNRLIDIIGSQSTGLDISGTSVNSMQARLKQRQADRAQSEEDSALIDDMQALLAGGYLEPSTGSAHGDSSRLGALSPRASGRSDSLARIGLFRGSSGINPMRIQADQLAQLRTMVSELRGLRRAVESED